MAEEFVGGADGNASINGGGFAALDVVASGAGTVSGFSITSTTNPVIDVKGQIELRDNSILVPATGAKGIDVSPGPAGLVTIADNEFFGDSTSSQTAINVRNGSEASITGNRVGSPGNAFNVGIFAMEGATAEIAGNTLRAFFQSGSVAGQPINVQDASATIIGNVVRNTQASPDGVFGITVVDTTDAPDAEATLSRNQLYGGGEAEGIRIHDASVTIDGDLVTGFEARGGRSRHWFRRVLPTPEAGDDGGDCIRQRHRRHQARGLGSGARLLDRGFAGVAVRAGPGVHDHLLARADHRATRA